MASSRNYRQIGVLLPVERIDTDRVIFDAEVLQNDQFMQSGFLFVRALQMGFSSRFNAQGRRLQDQSIFVVQSVSTGELFANKLLEAVWDPATGLSLPPLELRVSTYPHLIGDLTIQNGTDRKGVLPDMPCFNTLRWWQELDPQDITNPNCTVYSLFYKFCNGGTMQQLMEAYNGRPAAVPEHFIWLVAEQLFLSLVVMNYGGYPGQAGNWARLYHRDLHAANVFINYPPRGPGRVPRAGVEGNAFPEIVLGDFGASGIEGDGPAILTATPFGLQALEVWEDIYSVGEILRELSMTHMPHTGVLDLRPSDRWVQNVNQQQSAPPYSAELITLLQRFEYPGMVGGGLGSPMALGDARHTTFPSPQDIRDNLLPQAQARVQGFRRPANRPAGYYDAMDVSWTMPKELMPFNYIMRYAADAGDGPDGGPPSDHDPDGSDHGQDDGGSDGNVQRADSPSASEAGQDGSAQPSDPPQDPEGSHGSGGTDDDNHNDDGASSFSSSSSSSSSQINVLGAVRPPTLSSEQLAMRQLRKLHKWNGAKPRYELRSLEFRAPVIMPYKGPP